MIYFVYFLRYSSIEYLQCPIYAKGHSIFYTYRICASTACIFIGLSEWLEGKARQQKQTADMLTALIQRFKPVAIVDSVAVTIPDVDCGKADIRIVKNIIIRLIDTRF